MKANVEKANALGIEVGAYDLIGWTRNPNGRVPGTEAIATDGHSAGEGACWASRWSDFLLDQVQFMRNATGLSMIETDGPYAGYTCKCNSCSRVTQLRPATTTAIVGTNKLIYSMHVNTC